MSDVKFGSLSTWQKKDCINNSLEHTCDNPATQEAYISEGNLYVGIRCCELPECMERAKELALVSRRGSVWKPPAF
jgi:hypothetical protein